MQEFFCLIEADQALPRSGKMGKEIRFLLAQAHYIYCDWNINI
jgi:hypothetical protein